TPQDLEWRRADDQQRQSQLLQTLIQNTLEQLAIALPAYTAWSILAPDPLVHLAPASSILFLCGRIFFFFGYRHGASGRAFGFALTFYPTVGLLIWTTVLAIQRLALSANAKIARFLNSCPSRVGNSIRNEYASRNASTPTTDCEAMK
ncbi:MAPEG family protein, partial [Xanthomonas sp. Kuri4-1]